MTMQPNVRGAVSLAERAAKGCPTCLGTGGQCRGCQHTIAVAEAYGDWCRADERRTGIWRHTLLTGRLAHCCDDWGGLPIDETTPEINDDDATKCPWCGFTG